MLSARAGGEVGGGGRVEGGEPNRYLVIGDLLRFWNPDPV